MSELERFRTEIRTWLEQNAPIVVRGRPPMMMEVAGEEEAAELKRRAQALAAGDGRARLHRADVAQGVRRRRALAAAGQGAAGRDGAAQAVAAAVRHGPVDDRADPARARQRGAEARVPAEDRQRRAPLVPGLLRARRGQRPRVAALLGQARPERRALRRSTARRPGPAAASTRTGSSCWCAPTRPPSTTASRSC